MNLVNLVILVSEQTAAESPGCVVPGLNGSAELELTFADF